MRTIHHPQYGPTPEETAEANRALTEILSSRIKRYLIYVDDPGLAPEEREIELHVWSWRELKQAAIPATARVYGVARKNLHVLREVDRRDPLGIVHHWRHDKRPRTRRTKKHRWL